ncbi:MAG: ABC transporter substrate-binding protein [Acidimicrobiia bacterium]|nr:ABC transporter substrate-binding protein [Acidimicrobiia bacterium]MYD41882.1 ABC transporter substrate-binding protein [Acidimicrobiia bacterium]
MALEEAEAAAAAGGEEAQAALDEAMQAAEEAEMAAMDAAKTAEEAQMDADESQKQVQEAQMQIDELMSGGTIVFGTNQEPSQLDAFASTTVNDQAVVAQIYETLVILGQGMQIHQGLATHWNQSADATEVTFTLREGVTFHNGDSLDAAAVKAHFDRMKGDVSGSQTALIATNFQDAEVIDDYTVKLIFSAPVPDILIDLAAPGAAITNAAAVEALGDDAGRRPIGTGPFIFEEWVEGSHISLVRNPDWTWGAFSFYGTTGPARAERVVFRFIPDEQARTAALSTGEIHFLDLVPFQNIAPLEALDGITVEGFSLPGLPQVNYINPNISPTSDIRVRQAILHAVDQDAMVQAVFFGRAPRAYGPLSSDFAEYDPIVETYYPYDPDLSVELLEEAGWALDDDGIRRKDGETLGARIIENRSWNPWVTLLQAQLGDIGFDAEVITLEGGGYFQQTGEIQYELASMGDVFGSPATLRRDFHSSSVGPGNINVGHIADSELDALLDAASTEVNLGKRAEILSEVQRYIMDQAYIVPIIELHFFTAFSNALSGFSVDGTGFYKYFAGASISG